MCTCRDGIVTCTKLWCGWSACVIEGPTSCPNGQQCKEAAMHTCLKPPCKSTAWCQPVFGDHDHGCQANSTVVGPFNARVPFKVQRSHLLLGTQIQLLCSELRVASDLRDLSWKLPLIIISCDNANESSNIVQVCISTDEAGGTEGAELVVAAASVVRRLSCRWDGVLSCAPSQGKLVVLLNRWFVIPVMVTFGLLGMLRWRCTRTRVCGSGFDQCCGLLKRVELPRFPR
uniref:Protein jagged-1/2 predicted ferredoxin-like domain-containing protein n=1 Tax=Eptatretus burgeri TaxID=7764 RepID=A0A8C4QK14_EPTBU